MPLGPRKREGMLNKQGKICNPPSGSPTKKGGSGVGASGMAVKQEKQNKNDKTYKGPNYPQKDKNVVPFGGK